MATLILLRITEHAIVSALEDVPLGGCDTYQFGFRKREDSHTGYDSKVRDTLITIIEQFFAENDNVLLYICDTSDGREENAIVCLLDGLKNLPLLSVIH